MKKILTVKNLLYKYQVDVWGAFFSKKKYNNKKYRKLLFLFENSLRRKVIYNIKMFEVNKDNLNYTPGKTPLFYSMFFKYYLLQNQINSPVNELLQLWNYKRFKKYNKLSSTLYHKNKKFIFSVGKRLPYIKHKEYIISRKLETTAYQHFFCFKSKAKFLRFINKSVNPMNIQSHFRYGYGPYFTLLNQIYFSNIFPTTRFYYNLIKIGAIYVNEQVQRNPYQIMQLFDIFRIHPAYLRVCSRYLRTRLKKRQVIINIPNYLDFNYKIYSFCIWREPTKNEIKMTNVFPFQRSPFIDKGFNYKDLDFEFKQF